jgi:lipopolysaccharide transport system permease protein
MIPELILKPGRTEQNDWRQSVALPRDPLFSRLAGHPRALYANVMGIAWAVLRPFLTMLVFTVVAHLIAKLQAPGALPYALFVCPAKPPWRR